MRRCVSMVIATAYEAQRCGRAAGDSSISAHPYSPSGREPSARSVGSATIRTSTPGNPSSRRGAPGALPSVMPGILADRVKPGGAGARLQSMQQTSLGIRVKVGLLMFRRLAAISLAILAACLGVSSAATAASSHDIAAARTVLTAGYETVQAVLRSWPKVEASLRTLNHRFAHECPGIGAGTPQTEAEKRLSYEVAGAMWATAYHADGTIVRRFIHRVTGVTSSNPRLNRRVYKFLNGLDEMLALQVPDICSDVRAWTASGYQHVPTSTLQFDRHVEAIDVEIPSPKLAEPYLVASDRSLVPKLEHLITRFEEFEFTTGQQYWNQLLETLAVPQ